MKDRIVEFPNRYKVMPVAGQDGVVDLIPEPGVVTEVGTPLNKAGLLSDETARQYGLEGPEATVNNASKLALMQKAIGFNQHSEDKTFVVPDGVTEIKIYACAAGGAGSTATNNGPGGKAGQGIAGDIYNVTPGETISITVSATGNTVISGAGLNITLIANSVSASYLTYCFGFLCGTGGFSAANYGGLGGYGGYFGAGGGGGVNSQNVAGGAGGSGGAIIGGNGGLAKTNAENGGNAIPLFQYNENLKSFFKGFGSGGGGAPSGVASGKGGGTCADSASEGNINGGGGAGGYGAGGGGCGITSTPGKGSGGMVLITW